MTANAIAQLLTVPPYAVAAIVLVLLSYASDRLQSRGVFLASSSFLGGLGYLYVLLTLTMAVTLPYQYTNNLNHANRLLLVVPSNEHVRYFACFCITSGTYTTIGLIIAWCAYLFLCLCPQSSLFLPRLLLLRLRWI